jgi:2,4-diketo-3-deoxy-L-fuconate hydrolase
MPPPLARWLAAFAVVAALSIFLFGAWATRPLHDETLDRDPLANIELAPLAEAITLARSESGAVLLVVGVDASGIHAVDVAAASGRAPIADAIEAFEALGRRGLRSLAEAESTQHAWSTLALPFDEHYPHIAAGTNYKAHAEEVGHDGEPFLFPKLSHATAWNANVEAGGRLDHEVELCAALLTNHSAASPAELGYLLCGDFTDRWSLVRHIDLDSEMGTTGFPDAKGGPTRLPVGPFLLIPDNPQAYASLELRLYVNDQLRQRASAGLMIWSPEEILRRALADCETPYHVGEETIKVADCDRIDAGTLILTGTPAGVLFHPATIWNPFAYLREDDIVTSVGTYLGVLRNVVRTP